MNDETSNPDHGMKAGISRRSVLKAGIGASGSLLLPGLLGEVSYAATKHRALGTFPAGVSGDSVFVGIAVPLTGPYSSSGSDMKRGYELAVDHLNQGGGLVDHLSSLKGNGVLRKKVEYKIADTQTKPNPAVNAFTGFIHNHKAMMITGSVSSAVAVASEQLAQREHVIYMAGETTSNATTGKNRRRYGFRSQISAYMLAKALAPVIAKQLGKNRKAVYLVPDYTYGHTMFDSNSEFTEAQGWKTVGQQVYPLGTSDFSSYLLNIANSDADVFVNIAYGGDAVSSTKQAQQFGILDKMTLVAPLISPYFAQSLGAEIVQGVYGCMDFWWTMADRDPMAKAFVDSFDQKFQQKPMWGAELAYTQMMMWADAVERAGTYYPPKVIKTLESGHKLHLAMGEIYYRACDHQAIRDVPVVVGKKPAAMKDKDDYYEIVQTVSGEDAVPSCDHFPGKLGPYI